MPRRLGDRDRKQSCLSQQWVSNAVWNDEGGSEHFEGSKKTRLLVQVNAAAVVRHLEAKEFPTREESDALLVNQGC